MLNLVDLVDNEEKPVTPDEVKDLKLHNVWLDAKDPTDEEIAALAQKIDISKNLIKPTELPTFSSIRLVEDKAIFYFSSLSGEFDLKTLSSIAIIFAKTFIITIRIEDIAAFDRAKQDLHQAGMDTPSYVLYVLLDEVIRSYFSYVELVDDRSSRLEETILEKPTEEVLKEILGLKSKLTTFNRLLWYERSVLYVLKRSTLPFITETTKAYLDELIDDLTKQVDSISIFREVLTDATNSYRAAVSLQLSVRIEKLSDIVKILTALTVLVAIPTLIFTYYGQNFPLQEFKSVEFSYTLTIATFILSLFLVFVFKKKGWI